MNMRCRNLEFERSVDCERPLIPAFSPGGGEGGPRQQEMGTPRQHPPSPSFLQSTRNIELRTLNHGAARGLFFSGKPLKFKYEE